MTLTWVHFLKHTLPRASLGATLCGIALAGCSTTPTTPTYSQAELQERCESKGFRWHDGDSMRSFCEDNTVH